MHIFAYNSEEDHTYLYNTKILEKSTIEISYIRFTFTIMKIKKSTYSSQFKVFS